MITPTTSKTLTRKQPMTRTTWMLTIGLGLSIASLATPPQGADKKSAISAPAPAAPRNGATPAAPGAPAPDAPKVKVERGTGGHKVYRITEEIRIEGKIQKPEAFFFYQKSSINYDWQELKQDFIPKILDSVSKAPF
jgi:hypothetical protein